MKNNDRPFVTLIIIFAALTYYSPIFSQIPSPPSVSGITTDTEGPLAGVNILVKNTTRGAISDLQGAYSIQASTNDTLIFTYLGYKTQEARVGARTIVNIQMHPDATALDQVVINAGYYKVSDKEKTGSISRITAKEIENQPVSNPLAAMQGRMAGVEVVQNSGIPGGDFNIRIRGRNSLRADGNEPLFIVDGVPYPSQSLGTTTVSSILGGPQSPLNGISPTDIQSIEVLKDADATAIYGSRGANGVVLITTKKGKAGKTEITVNTESGLGKVTRMQKYLNTEQYLAMRRQAFANDGITDYPLSAYDVNGTWDQNRYTDWQKELFGGTTYFNRTQAAITGGNAETRFLIRGTHQKESTVFPGDFDYKKNSVLANLNHISKDDKLHLQFSANYVLDNNDLPTTSFVFQSKAIAPNAPAIFDENGDLNWGNGTFSNPLALLNSKYLSSTNNLIANVVIQYEIFRNLNIKTNLGYNQMHLDESRAMPNTIYNPAFGLDSSFSSIRLNNAKRSSWIVEPQIEYKKDFGKAEIQILVGSSFQNEISQRTIIDAAGFTSNSLLYDSSSASFLSIESNAEEKYRYNAVFGRINLNWNKKYILNLTGRRDGSSRFGPERSFADFGAIGAAWLFSEEKQVKENLSFLSFGKLRASYGSSGNDQIGNYKYLDTYIGSGNSYQGILGLSPSQLYNPNFGWESNKKFEVALELGLLKDRIFLTTAYYQNRSSNQLVGIPLPGTTGFNSLNANLNATVQNTGLEVELNTINIDDKDFRWTSSFNFSLPRNKLLSFPGLENSTYSNRYVIGQPTDISLMFNYLGIDPNTGIYMFQDYDNDGSINNPNDLKMPVYRGVDYFGGVANTFSYKNLSLDILFQFVKQTGWTDEYTTGLPGTRTNQPSGIMDNWLNPGDSSSHQILTAGYNDDASDAFDNYQNSSAVVGDASYIRLKNLALSYQIPVRPFGINCRVYILGQNLFTITNFKGSDPESRNAEQLPPLRMLNVGTEIKF